MAAWIWTIIVIAAVLVLWVILAYNRLVRLTNQADNAWAQIDVQLKRRVDLIPNLVETVKGYTKYEKETLENITKARSALQHATSLSKKAEASNMITESLKTLFAVAENYPDLKANQNFLSLQEELSGTESKIAYSRQAYNDACLSLENAVESFPTNLLANMFNFKKKEMFAVSEKEREAVKVKF